MPVLAKQAAESLQISRDAMVSYGLVAHDDNPFVIGACWKLLPSLLKSGCGKKVMRISRIDRPLFHALPFAWVGRHRMSSTCFLNTYCLIPGSVLFLDYRRYFAIFNLMGAKLRMKMLTQLLQPGRSL